MNNNEWKPGILLLSGIEDEYVSEVISSTKRKGSTVKWLYAAAACFLLLASAIAISILIKKPDDDISALVPISPSHNNDTEKTASPGESGLPNETGLPGITAEPTVYYPVLTAVPTDRADISTAVPTIPGESTPNPTNTGTPTTTPKPTCTPTASPRLTAAPTAAPKPTAAPTATPKPTVAPTAAPKPTITPKPWSPTPPPGQYPSSHLFFSEEEFIEAVLSGDEYYLAISWVTHYYKPANIPQGCSFHFIDGDRSGVYLRYEGNSSSTLQGYNFCWYPEKDPNKIAESAYAWCYEDSPYNVEEYHDHYIIRDPDWYIWEVYWVQDGQVFHAKFWDGFSYELVDTVCDARLIPVK